MMFVRTFCSTDGARLAMLLGMLLALGAVPLQAQPVTPTADNSAGPAFRIESSLYVDGQAQPVTRNLTTFTDQLVFDFQLDPQSGQPLDEVVIYDRRNRKLFLLDSKRKVQLELHDVRLLKLLDGVRREAEQDQRTRFLVTDEFDEKVDAESKRVSLSSPNMTYQFVGTAPEDDRVMPVYFEFLDQFTRLQASDPKKLPPFPRIRLNQSIRRVGWVPTRVDILVKPNALFKTAFKAHTEHQLDMGIKAEHQSWMTRAKQNWSAFQPVSLAEYRGFATPARIANPLKNIRR